ncbi:hypothetical protein QFZ67_001428 [Streptomyces sp. V1I1]|nr:hypothetical protein [Streptomyces sp. V1I1]
MRRHLTTASRYASARALTAVPAGCGLRDGSGTKHIEGSGPSEIAVAALAGEP